MGILLVPRLGGLSTTPISAYFFKKSTTVEVASFAGWGKIALKRPRAL
jgi:hypothetical protein